MLYEISDKGWDLYGLLLNRVIDLDKSIEEKYGTTIAPKGKTDYSDPDFDDYNNTKTRLQVLQELDKDGQAPWDYGAPRSHPHSKMFQALLDKGFIETIPEGESPRFGKTGSGLFQLKYKDWG